MFHLLWEEKEIFVSPGDADWKVTKQYISNMYAYKRKQRYIFCVKVNKCAFFTKKVQSLNLNVWLWRFDNEMSKYFGKFKCPLFSAFMLICKLSSISCQLNKISCLMKMTSLSYFPWFGIFMEKNLLWWPCGTEEV